MKKKEDRRILYTRMVIKESFLSLIQEKPLDKITIKEICEKADINRARREVILITNRRAFYIAVYDIWSVSCTQQLTFICGDGSAQLFTK